MSGLTLYIYKLEQGMWYVGTTKDPDRRDEEHKTNKGSEWTKKYKVIAEEKKIENASPFDEDRYVEEYMSIYGIANVRGGIYSQITLDDATIAFLEKKIKGATQKCFRCGRSGHFIAKCFATTDVTGKPISNTDKTTEDTQKCSRCGRSGHFTEKCFAKVDITGKPILSMRKGKWGKEEKEVDVKEINVKEVKEIDVKEAKEEKEEKDDTMRGARWSKIEETKMINLLKQGKSPEEIAEIHKRTPNAIKAKIQKMAAESHIQTETTHESNIDSDPEEEREKKEDFVSDVIGVVDRFIEDNKCIIC